MLNYQRVHHKYYHEDFVAGARRGRHDDNNNRAHTITDIHHYPLCVRVYNVICYISYIDLKCALVCKICAHMGGHIWLYSTGLLATLRYWPFGDPFIEKRKLYERRRKEAEQQLDALARDWEDSVKKVCVIWNRLEPEPTPQNVNPMPTLIHFMLFFIYIFHFMPVFYFYFFKATLSFPWHRF